MLITAHDAFGYFSGAYGIAVRSVQGLSTDSEAGVFLVLRWQSMLGDALSHTALPGIVLAFLAVA